MHKDFFWVAIGKPPLNLENGAQYVIKSGDKIDVATIDGGEWCCFSYGEKFEPKEILYIQDDGTQGSCCVVPSSITLKSGWVFGRFGIPQQLYISSYKRDANFDEICVSFIDPLSPEPFCWVPDYTIFKDVKGNIINCSDIFLNFEDITQECHEFISDNEPNASTDYITKDFKVGDSVMVAGIVSPVMKVTAVGICNNYYTLHFDKDYRTVNGHYHASILEKVDPIGYL